MSEQNIRDYHNMYVVDEYFNKFYITLVDLKKQLTDKITELENKLADALECNSKQAEMIDKLEEANRWIPVSERLPETDGVVLLRGYEGSISTGYFTGTDWVETPTGYLLRDRYVAYWKPTTPPEQP